MPSSESARPDPRMVGGTIPIILTPFTETNEVDWDALAAESVFLASAGISWAGLGYGSEIGRLTASEVDAISTTIHDETSGSIGVISNAEVTSVRSGIDSLQRAAQSGPAAVMVRPGQLLGLSDQQLFDCFAEVVTAGGIPVVLQDAPQHTGVQLSANLLARLLRDVPDIVAVKIEPPSGAVAKIGAVSAELAGAPGRIIGGSGGKDYILELEKGSHGTMPGPAFAELFEVLAKRLKMGDTAGAWRMLSRFLPIMGLGAATANMDGFLHSQKHLLVKRGVLASSRLRQPSTPIPHEHDELLDRVFDYLDIDAALAECRRELEL